MSTQIGTSIPIQPISTMAYGVQMNAALEVMNATTPAAVDRYIPVAMEFASLYDFYLPMPRERCDVSVRDFNTGVVPFFAVNMRDRFNGAFEDIRDSENSFREYQEQDLLATDVVDVVRAGLLAHSVAESVLTDVEEELKALVESYPLPKPVVKDSRLKKVVKSPLLHSALLGGIMKLFDINFIASFFTSFIVYCFLKSIQAETNPPIKKDDLKKASESREALALVQGSIGRLDEMREELPIDIELPAPTTSELRKAHIMMKIRDASLTNIWGFNIINSLDDFVEHVERHGGHARYLVVELPRGEDENSKKDPEKEIRLTTANVLYFFIILRGEKIVGAGEILYHQMKSGRRILKVVGDEFTLPTTEDAVDTDIFDEDTLSPAPNAGLKAVEDIFRDILSEGIDIEVLTGGFISEDEFNERNH